MRQEVGLKGIGEVVLQFMFMDASAAPSRGLRCLPDETSADVARRRMLPSGELVISPTADCQLAACALLQLGREGYRLGQATRRLIPGYPPSARLRYLFYTDRGSNRMRLPAESQKAVSDDLVQICFDAMWTVKAYRNPATQDGLVSLAVVMAGRRPFADRNGQPVTARARDVAGHLVGDPQPLVPKFILEFRDQCVCILPNR